MPENGTWDLIRNYRFKIKRMKANWMDYFLPRTCLLKYVLKEKIEGRIEVMERQERRRKQLLNELNEKIVCSKLKKSTSS
jgi:hypothetical protein